MKIKYKKILITGSGGFIGFHLAKNILDKYSELKIIGIDSMNNYYDPKIGTTGNRVEILRNQKT